MPVMWLVMSRIPGRWPTLRTIIKCCLVQIFIGLTQLFEGQTIRPLDGAHADVGEANLAELFVKFFRRMQMRTSNAPCS
jgi:hypothetical protein